MDNINFILRDVSFKEKVLNSLKDNFRVSELTSTDDFVIDRMKYVIYRKDYKKDEFNKDELFVIFIVIEFNQSEIISQREGEERNAILNLMGNNNNVFSFSFSYRRNDSFELFYQVIDVMNNLVVKNNYSSHTIIEDSYSGIFLDFIGFYNKWSKKKGFFFEA